jgi:hypothetical protein
MKGEIFEKTEEMLADETKAKNILMDVRECNDMNECLSSQRGVINFITVIIVVMNIILCCRFFDSFFSRWASVIFGKTDILSTLAGTCLFEILVIAAIISMHEYIKSRANKISSEDLTFLNATLDKNRKDIEELKIMQENNLYFYSFNDEIKIIPDDIINSLPDMKKTKLIHQKKYQFYWDESQLAYCIDEFDTFLYKTVLA